MSGSDQLKVEDLRGGDIVTLICERCEARIEMRAKTVQTVTRSYRLLSSFGQMHACGRCFHVGAEVALKV